MAIAAASRVGEERPRRQPLEDLAASADFEAETDAGGEFSVEVDAGRYFVYVIPPDDDETHLPGGNFVRDSIAFEEGTTSVFNILISEKPSDDATFVGSSTCLECHPGHATAKQTLHFLGFRKLTATGTVVSSLQDLSQFPDADGALEYFADGNDNDNTGSGDAYGYRITTSNGYNILLGVDGTGYFQAMESVDGTKVSEELYIAFTYGGEGRYKQRFVTRLDQDGQYTAAAADGSYYVLPGQYNETEGDPNRGSEVTEAGWVTYHAERWAAPSADGGPAGLSPVPAKSFDNDCSGCHFTGVSLTVNADGLYQAHAVSDDGGPLDFDGDGENDEINVGCERCHGPGSEHAARGAGFIVQPDYLPPGRANLICGQCHGRGSGNTDNGGGFPYRENSSTGEYEFVRAGLTPAEFFGTEDGSGILPEFGTTGGFFKPIDYASNDGSWLDDAGGYGSSLNHSKKHHQQYFDHSRAVHSRNPYEMLTCWDCHDPHGREQPAQVRKSVDNNVLCLDCHAGHGDFAAVTGDMVETVEDGGALSTEMKEAIDEHITATTFEMVGEAMNLGPSAYANPAGTELGSCTLCHMPKTAKTAAWITDDEGYVIRGDVTSHTFLNVSPDTSEAMALDGVDPVPNSCVDCHRGIFRAAWPDYRYVKR